MPMRLVAVLLVALPLFAQSDPFARALAAARANEGFTPFCDGRDDPRGVVCEAVSGNDDAEAVIAKVANELSVSPDSARAMAMAFLAFLRDPANTDGDGPILEALVREPNRAPLIASLAQLAQESDEPSARLASLVPLIGTDKRAALASADVVRSPDALRLLAPVYAAHPDDLEILDAIAGHADNEEVRAAFGPLRITSRGAELRQPGAGIGSIAVQLQNIAALGAPQLLMTAFDALPPAIRESLITREPETTGGLRLSLAAAAVLAGRTALARRFDAGLRDRVPDDGNAARELLAASLGIVKADPFDVIAAQFSGAFSGSTAGVRGQLFARFAEEHGYPDLAAELRAESQWWRGIEIDVADALRAEVAVIERYVEESQPPAAHRTHTPVAPSSLRAARIVPFEERASRPPAADIPSAAAAIIDCSDAERVARTTNLPAYVSPIRMERDGDDVVAIAVSSAVDPAGELGLGGYWVLRSNDGGATWREYYTGLRQNMPYVIPPASALPLLHGDALRIEVEVKELDETSITFPPVALRVKRSERGLYLDFPWAELARDSDGDGLTDLLEERLTTDPNELDTDGDGIADGEDRLPRVPASGTPTVAAEVLAAALDNFGLGGGAIVTGIGGGEDGVEAQEQSCQIRASRTGEPVLFLIGDPALFAALRLTRRTIVMTEEESQAYQAKFGTVYPAHVLHFAIDPTGTRAVIELNQSWTGITFALKKTKEGGWDVTVLSSWIT